MRRIFLAAALILSFVAQASAHVDLFDVKYSNTEIAFNRLKNLRHVATNCNPPSGFLQQNGVVTLGDQATFGPGCGEIEDTATGTGPIIIGVPYYFGAGYPTCDPRSKGATASAGSSNTDDSVAFGSCATLLASLGGGVLNITPGTYCIKSGVTIGAGVLVQGSSNNSAVVLACGADHTVFTFNGGHASMRDVSVGCKGSINDPLDTTFGATQDCVLVTSVDVGADFENDVLAGGYNTLNWQSSEGTIRTVALEENYGQALLNDTGGIVGYEISADNNATGGFPVTRPQAIVAWVSGTTYAAGTIVFVNYNATNWLILCTRSGTSAASIITMLNYGQTISDGTGVGTPQWQLWAWAGGDAIYLGNGATENYWYFTDITGAEKDGLEVAGNNIANFECFRCIVSQESSQAIVFDATATGDFEFWGTSIGDIAQTSTITVSTNNGFAGNLAFHGGGWTAGFSSQTAFQDNGANSVLIEGTQQVNGFGRGFDVSGAYSHIQFLNDNFQNISGAAISIDNASADYINIIGNQCASTVSTCISNAATNPHGTSFANNGSSITNIPNSSLQNSSITFAGTAISLGGSGGLSNRFKNSIASDVALNNVSNYFDGPVVAQGTSGTFYASGTVTVGATSNDTIACKLWDGTTVIDSTSAVVPVSSYLPYSLSGYITNPAGNLKISCKDMTSTTGDMHAAVSGNFFDSSISVLQVQ